MVHKPDNSVCYRHSFLGAEGVNGAIFSHVAGSKTQVLYIEDDEHLCLLFMERMQEDGYSVDFALSAEAGLNKFHSGFYQ